MSPSVERVRMTQDRQAAFRAGLVRETELLHTLIEAGELSDREPAAAVDVDAWLVDGDGRPAPRNGEFLARLGAADVGAGAVHAAIVIRVPAHPVAADGLVQLEQALLQRWQQAGEVALEMGLRVVAVGTLPTLRDEDLRRSRLSPQAEDHALHLQLLGERLSSPLQLDIEGPDGRHLRCEYVDVLPEAAAASCVWRLALPGRRLPRVHDAAVVASAPLVAMAGNSPLLFGQALWQETRIPLIEQALGLQGVAAAGTAVPPARAGLGSGFAGDSPIAFFRDNLERFTPLLPLPRPAPPQELAHLRAHNATVWRWNRPTAGFDADGRVQLGLEMRLLPAGPGIGDMVAQFAAAIGVATHWARGDTAEGAGDPPPPAARLSFGDTLLNLQAAARHGLAARLHWFDGREASAAEAARDVLRDARQGLLALGVDAAAAAGWLDRLEQRVATKRTGARWQLARLHLRQGDLAAMTRDYADRQAGGEPVHVWT